MTPTPKAPPTPGPCSWDDLPPGVMDTMEALGDFGPTVHPEARELKGIKYDGEGGFKHYLTANTLRQMAADMVIVADWLDARARSALAAGASAAPDGGK